MSCSACSAHIENKVNSLDSAKASVNLLSNSMTVEYDESILNTEDIIHAVTSIGYGAEIHTDNTKTSFCIISMNFSPVSDAGYCVNYIFSIENTLVVFDSHRIRQQVYACFSRVKTINLVFNVCATSRTRHSVYIKFCFYIYSSYTT